MDYNYNTLKQRATLRAGNRQSVLHVAARSGSIELARYMIENRVTVNEIDTDGNLPIHVSFKNLEVLKLLLKAGANYTARNADGDTFAHIAARTLTPIEFSELVTLCTKNLDVGIIKGMFKKKIYKVFKIKNRVTGRTPLHERLFHKMNTDDKTMELLIRILGVKSSSKDKWETSVVHLAIENGHSSSAIHTLIRHCPNIDLRNKKGQSALHFAAMIRDIQLVECLLSQGLELNKLDQSGSSELFFAAGNLEMIKYLIEMGSDISVTNQLGDTIAHEAAFKLKDKEAFHDLVVYISEDINFSDIFHQKNQRGHTPLYVRLHNMKDIKEETVKLLLDIIRQSGSSEYTDIESLLQQAVLDREKVDYVQMLVNSGVNYAVKNSHMQNLLHIAADQGNLDLVKYFHSLGLPLNERDESGETALTLSAMHLKVLVYLIEQGADVSVVDNELNNVAHKAAVKMLNAEDFDDFVEFIWVQGNIEHIFNKANKEGQTPLQFRLISGDLEIKIETVDTIIKSPGFDISVVDAYGYNLFFAAVVGRRSVEVLDVLVKAGVDCNASCLEGKNALHIIASQKFRHSSTSGYEAKEKTLLYLLSLGIDTNKKERNGKTAFDIAKEALPYNGDIENFAKYYVDDGDICDFVRGGNDKLNNKYYKYWKDYDEYVSAQRKIKDILKQATSEEQKLKLFTLRNLK